MAKRTRLTLQQPEKPAQRRLAVWCGWLPLALLALGALAVGGALAPSHPAKAADEGADRLIVDAAAPADEDTDGDARFRTLKGALTQGTPPAYSTLEIEPGRYEIGTLSIAKPEGLTIAGSGQPGQTVLQGQLRIQASDIRIQGITLEAEAAAPGLVIRERGARIERVRIKGGSTGMLLEGTHSATLRDVIVHSQTSDGLVLRDAYEVTVRKSEFRGNDGLGVLIEDARDLTLAENRVALNGLGGIWARRSQRVELTGNSVQDNALVGIALQQSSQSRVAGNRLSANEAGVLLLGASENHVADNEFTGQRSAGVVLKNGALNNTIADNKIQGTQGRGATGIRLSGDANGNRLTGNTIADNGRGVVLAANDSGAPSDNVLTDNTIARSDGVGLRVAADARINAITGNTIRKNLEAGVVGQGRNTAYRDNTLTANGTAGLVLEGARNTTVRANTIAQNGTHGLALSNASDALLEDNRVRANERTGIRLAEGRHLRILNNDIAANGTHGVQARKAQTLVLMGNKLTKNQQLGASLTATQDAVLQGNGVSQNGEGGLALARVQGADLTANRVTANLRFGLRVGDSSTDVSADRNYWGDPSGPAGAFAGQGNAVLGLSGANVTPWLPDRPDKLSVQSVSSLTVSSPESDRIVYEAGERIGLTVAFHDLGRNGRQDLLSKGVVLSARYDSPPEETPPLAKELGFYTLTVDGADTGTAEITLSYDEADQPAGIDPSALELFVLEEGEWQPLDGRASADLNHVTGTIDVAKLDGRLIALGMAEAEDDGPIGNVVPPVRWGELGRAGPATATVAGGLALIALLATLGVLTARRLSGRPTAWRPVQTPQAEPDSPSDRDR